jgi:3-deoxy-D-manno-octulosonic-acid transferase
MFYINKLSRTPWHHLSIMTFTTTFVFLNQIITVHLFIYNIFLLLYSIGIRITALWNPKARLWLNGRKDIWRQVAEVRSKKPEAGHKNPEPETQHPPLVWMHCSSLGEFEQGRPVLEALKQQYPNIKILVTFFSPSGYEVRKNYSGADHVLYLPMDSKTAARQFLSLVQPSLVIWIKYEYWYYYLTEIKKKHIPCVLVSGIFRKDQPFFKWYGRLHRYMLESFNHLFVQTESSRQLLATIGFANNVTISGDTRFDRVVQIAEQFEPIPAIEQFCGNSTVIVAGSTWPEDEEELDHYANTHPDIKFIIAPHEIHEEHLKEIEKLFKHSARFSKLPPARGNSPVPIPRNRPSGNQQPNTLIIDNIGMLSKLYKYATITYVGGGFGDDGVHNVLEAAVYGKPVVFGPVYDKYIEAVELVQQGGGLVINTALEAEQTFNRLLADAGSYQQACQAASNYVYYNKGATGSIMQFIQENRLLTS